MVYSFLLFRTEWECQIKIYVLTLSISVSVSIQGVTNDLYFLDRLKQDKKAALRRLVVVLRSRGKLHS